jgi:hypothetical protein
LLGADFAVPPLNDLQKKKRLPLGTGEQTMNDAVMNFLSWAVLPWALGFAFWRITQ